MDAQADLSLRWAHSHFVCIVMSWRVLTVSSKLLYYFAGFIHGMCDSKDVEVDKKYILFLDEKTEGQDYYMQSGAAEMSTRDKDLVKQCNLEMRYPQGRENIILAISSEKET